MIKIKNILAALGLTTLVGLMLYTIGTLIVMSSNATNSSTTLVTPNIPTLNLDSKLPVTKKNVQKLVLKSDEVVFLEGYIGPNSLAVARNILELSKKHKPVYLLINSPGGSVLDGAQIVSAIESSKEPVYTVCLQICASMAAIIHQYGTKRFSVDRSILMFHDASGGLQGSMPQMKSRLKLLDNYVTKMDANVAMRTGQSLDSFLSKVSNEIWLDAEDAMAQKYSDGLVSVFVKDLDLIHIMTPEEGFFREKFNVEWQ